mmetsp:Transcript_11303/g.38515  ORF Transcript_11303/g.38515 Transcript_11303/m.38515 type:complete len:106 (-) Transcript_11303:403-720(-)
MYKYKGTRSVEDLAAFAKGGFRQAAGTPVPPPPTLVDLVKASFQQLFDEIVGLFKTHFGAAVVMTGLALCTGVTVGFALGLICAPTPKPRRRPAPGSGEQDNKED